METRPMMNEKQLFQARMEVESFNKTLQKNGRGVKTTLGKDDFLRLLITQLENQDPTKPLEDREFIAQMAQFSSLEQMTSINTTLSNLITQSKLNLSYSLLGRRVEVVDRIAAQTVSGTVTSVSFELGEPTITINGKEYSIDDVAEVSLYGEEDQS